MSCKFCNETIMNLDEETEIIGGYPLTFEAEKCQGYFTKLTYININEKSLNLSHYKRGSGRNLIKLNQCKINYCPMCGKKL